MIYSILLWNISADNIKNGYTYCIFIFATVFSFEQPFYTFYFHSVNIHVWSIVYRERARACVCMYVCMYICVCVCVCGVWCVVCGVWCVVCCVLCVVCGVWCVVCCVCVCVCVCGRELSSALMKHVIKLGNISTNSLEEEQNTASTKC